MMMTHNMKAQIEVIPCKVCGDKSSGVHYGVITCEGCKGFFRRSQSGPVNYTCARTKNCIIDRVNRNRCQFCRLQKCLQLGMSRDAVKFGRMSKKQRERVEDEASMHKLNGGYEATFDPNSNQFIGSDGATYTQQMAVGPDGTQYTIIQQPTATFKPESIDLDLMVKAVSDAHSRTCLFTTEQVAQMRQQPLPQEQLDTYKRMSHKQLWMEVADKITMAVQQIIEFSKMIPGFMNLSQDDQIMLLKAGSFELALLRLSRAYDPGSNSVLFGTHFVPLEAFDMLNEEEKELMNSIFSFAQDMIALNLTENELALICAAVLVSSDRPGVKEADPIHRLQERILAALKMEITKNHPEDEAFKVSLLEKVPTLRALSLAHIEVLNKFKQSSPHMEFPALHKELFSLDVLETVASEVIAPVPEVTQEIVGQTAISQEDLNAAAAQGQVILTHDVATGKMTIVHQGDDSQVLMVRGDDGSLSLSDGSQILVTQNNVEETQAIAGTEQLLNVEQPAAVDGELPITEEGISENTVTEEVAAPEQPITEEVALEQPITEEVTSEQPIVEEVSSQQAFEQTEPAAEFYEQVPVETSATDTVEPQTVTEVAEENVTETQAVTEEAS